MQWFPFFSSDFLGATIGLSHAERGCYALMLVMYYEMRAPYPADPTRTYRILGCESDEQKRVVDYVLSEFFVLRDDGWYQPKAEKVIADIDARTQQAHDRGKLSAQARMAKYGSAQPKAFRKPFESVSKASRKAPELTTTTTTKYLNTFGQFWDAFPRKVAKSAALRAWGRLNPDDALRQTILGALKKAKASPDWCKDGGHFIPHPATWINGRRWEDNLSPIQGIAPTRPRSHQEQTAEERAGLCAVCNKTLLGTPWQMRNAGRVHDRCLTETV